MPALHLKSSIRQCGKQSGAEIGFNIYIVFKYLGLGPRSFATLSNNNEQFLIFDHLPLSSKQASLTPHVTPHLGEAALADAGLSHC